MSDLSVETLKKGFERLEEKNKLLTSQLHTASVLLSRHSNRTPAECMADIADKTINIAMSGKGVFK